MSRPVLPRQLVKLHADLPRKSMRRLTPARLSQSQHQRKQPDFIHWGS